VPARPAIKEQTMLQRLYLHAMILPLVPTGLGCAHQQHLEPAVRSILDRQAAAWNRGDLNAFLEPYWRSNELTFSSGGRTRYGWDATRRRYQNRYPTREAMGHLTFEIERVQPLCDDAALVLGRWHLQRDDDIGGNFSLVFQKIAGVWRIIHDHTSVAEPGED
jgi:uncharacterized protein (TIGR02246 family)